MIKKSHLEIDFSYFRLDCHNRKIEIQSLVQILWGTMSFCVTVSIFEIIYFYCTNKTWIEFIYADEEKPLDDVALNDGQEKDIVHKSKYNYFFLILHKKYMYFSSKTEGAYFVEMFFFSP